MIIIAELQVGYRSFAR